MDENTRNEIESLKGLRLPELLEAGEVRVAELFSPTAPSTAESPEA